MRLQDLNLKCVFISGSSHPKKQFTKPESDRDVEGWMLSRIPGPYLLRNVLEQHNIQTEVFDFCTLYGQEQWDHLYRFFDVYKPDIFSVTNSFLSADDVNNILSKLRTRYPDTCLLVGGSGGSDAPTPDADYKVYGYGENAIVKILEHHFLGSELKYKETECNTKYINAIHTYPAWPKDDYAIWYKESDFVTEFEPLTLEMSRGCRFKCKFCTWPILGIKEDTSQKELDNMVACLTDNYNKFGTTKYVIADDTFNDRTVKIEKLVYIVEQLPFKPSFSAYIRIDLLWSMPEQIDLLIKANVDKHFYGIESLNIAGAKAIGKGKQAVIAKDAILNVQQKYKEHGVTLGGFVSLIAGLPTETEEEIFDTVKWVAENWAGEYTVFPLMIASDGLNLSAFETDMSKYGYINLDEKDGFDYTGRGGHMVNWHNGIMSFKEAVKVAYKCNSYLKEYRQNNPKIDWSQFNEEDKDQLASIPHIYIDRKFNYLKDNYQVE